MPSAHLQASGAARTTASTRSTTSSTSEGMVVLDVVHLLQATQTPDLAVRWNCKAGKCGSCSAEINGKPRLMCMTRMNTFNPGETITIAPMKTFPLIRDLVTDVCLQLRRRRKLIPSSSLAPREADGTHRMQQIDIDRIQEFRKCIECFLCQDVCHVIRDHPENNGGLRRTALLHPARQVGDAPARHAPEGRHCLADVGLDYCNITKCCTEVCPEGIHITDNGIIPMKERAMDLKDPVRRIGRKLFGRG